MGVSLWVDIQGENEKQKLMRESAVGEVLSLRAEKEGENTGFDESFARLQWRA